MNSGIQAPSGDHAQPWYIRAEGNNILIALDPLTDTSFF